MGEMFDSLNLYESLVVVSAGSAEELAEQLKAIKTPIKIVSINNEGALYKAFILGNGFNLKIKGLKNGQRKRSR